MTTGKTEQETDRIVRSFDQEEPEEEREGFSLIELMVVIAVIAILSAIAVLSILHYRMVIRVDASARNVAGHLRIARANAIRDGRTWSFGFHVDLDKFYYGPNQNADANFDSGRTYNYSLEPGIVFGYTLGTEKVPAHPDPTANDCAAMSVAASTTYCLHNASVGDMVNMIHFHRNGSIFMREKDASDVITDHITDGVAYLIPDGDQSGTGLRDDRQRATDWIGITGRIRLWRYASAEHEWY